MKQKMKKKMKQMLKIGWMLGDFLCSSELRTCLRILAKPTAVAFGVVLLMVLVGQFDVRVAEAAPLGELACPEGTEEDGGLCYPPCDAGFDGVGPVCFQVCPAGYTDDGALCRKDAHIFPKQSYGRGAGTGLVCGANQEAQSGLCYPRCATGYYGLGPVCWAHCKAGYADHGATCFRHIFDFYGKQTYGRGAGAPVSTCPAGMERNGALCYPRCAAGYVGNGPVCFQRCPAGYKDDGALCRLDAHIFAKASYGRGVGDVMNTVPFAHDETLRTAKDTPITGRFLVTEPNDDPLSDLIIIQRPSNGRLSNGIYTPDPGFEGVDTILWKTNDGKHDSNVAIATILVGNVDANSAPVALDRFVNVFEDTPISVDVLCDDADGDELFYQLLEKPKHGEYTWQPPNTVIYTPTVDFVGTDYFTFRSHDGQDVSNTSIITLTVTAVNDAPVAVSQAISTTRNNNAGIALQAVDVEGDPITYTIATSPTYGLLSGEGVDWVYTPNLNFTGEDSFTFQAMDDKGAATTGTISITVNAVNSVPVAESQALSTTQDSALAINLSATDADGDELTYTLVTTPTYGVLEGDGADWVYTPNVGFAGSDLFTFAASDSLSTSAAATVTLDVAAAPNEAILAGIVFEDSNGNGQPDEGDRGVSGLTVTLTPTGRSTASFSAVTDSIGSWLIEGVPFGDYTVRIESTSAVQLAAPVETQITVDARGLVLAQTPGVSVSSRSFFLPVVVR